MKIYISHSRKISFKEELYKPLKESRFNLEHEIILPHEIHENAQDFVTKDIIKTCDAVIAEVSFPATGQGIELGWADSFNRPIICIYKKGSVLAGSLNVVCKNFIEYEDSDDMIEKIANILKSDKF